MLSGSPTRAGGGRRLGDRAEGLVSLFIERVIDKWRRKVSNQKQYTRLCSSD